MAEVITILSGSGGMGKSFFACNLAYALKKSHHSVLLAELSFGSVSHDIIMGTAPVTLYNIADALSGGCEPYEAVSSFDEGCIADFVSASPVPCGGELSFGSFARAFKSHYDYIICDASSLGDAERCGVFDMQGKVLYMTDDSPVSIRNTALNISRIRNISDAEVYLLLSKVIIDNGKEGISAEDIIDECGAPLIGIIPYDSYAKRSILEGRPIYDSDTFASRAIRNISERILHNEIPEFETGVIKGIFNKNKFIPK